MATLLSRGHPRRPGGADPARRMRGVIRALGAGLVAAIGGTLAALAVLGALLAAPPAAAAGLGGPPADGNAAAQRFAGITLTTHDGRRVRLYEDLLQGKAVAVNTVYTRCDDSCPLETAQMARLQRVLGPRVGRDVFMYSISIDPAHDTPEVLRRYAARYGAGPGWVFLTGAKDEVARAVRLLGLARASDARTKDGHTPMLMLGHEASGQWMRNSAVDNPQFLAATMRTFFGWRDPVVPAGGDGAPLATGPGEHLFHSRCAACHRVGGGDAIGPDLAGVTARRTRAWLARFIAAPDAMVAAGDPDAVALRARSGAARMPNIGLSADEVAQVIDYLETSSPSAGHVHAAARSAPHAAHAAHAAR